DHRSGLGVVEGVACVDVRDAGAERDLARRKGQRLAERQTIARARAIEPGNPSRSSRCAISSVARRRPATAMRPTAGFVTICGSINAPATLATGRSPHYHRPTPAETEEGSMKIHRLYADKNGESHFQDVEVEYAETTRAGRLSKRIAATGIIFREVQPDYDLDWHPAPRRQYI